MFKRKQRLPDLGSETCFLWGPRQTGKSTLVKQRFPKALVYDLLLADEFSRLKRNPSLLRQDLLALQKKTLPPIIIDEIQKCPDLLDEVQWLIVNHGFQFILCGSSARKLRRGHANLLGGRALRYELFPLVSAEIPQFDLLRALNHGLIPRHYIGAQPKRMLAAYLATYLKEEVAAEALVRNLAGFGRFLEVAAFSNGGIPVFQNIGSDCGISPPTVKEYFQILEDTLLARFCPAFQKRPKRRVVQSPKFYLFDVGLTNHLLKRGPIEIGGESFGNAFEHFIYMELLAYSHYSGKDFAISYWRTTSQLEVDFILGDHQVAVEVKGVPEVKTNHLRGLHAFAEEYKVQKQIVVSLDPRKRLLGSCNIFPWQQFLNALWRGEII